MVGSLPPAAGKPTAIAAFEEWTAKFAAADAASRDAALAEGLRLADARKAEVLALMRSHPNLAVEQTLPYGLRHSLPSQFDDLVEHRVQGNGDIHMMSVLPRPGAAGTVDPIRTSATIDGVEYAKAFLDFRRRQLGSQHGVPVQGVALGGVVALSDSPARVIDPQEAAALAAAGAAGSANAPCTICSQPSSSLSTLSLVAIGNRLVAACCPDHAASVVDHAAASVTTTGPSLQDIGTGQGTASGSLPRTLWKTQGRLNVLLIRIAFVDDPREPISISGAYDVMSQVNEWYRTASYNLVQIVPTVTPLIIMPKPVQQYGFYDSGSELLADARAAARAVGYDYLDYDYEMVGFSPIDFAGWKDWAGLAMVHGRGLWLQDISPLVVVHELGHNLGLGHANFSDTTGTKGAPNPGGIPNTTVDIDSLVGQDAILKHSLFVDSGVDSAYDKGYGNPTDWMGNQGNDITTQFSSLLKYKVGWITPDAVASPTGSGTNRIYAFDGTDVTPGRAYALAFRKDQDISPTRTPRTYWIDHRALMPGNPNYSDAVSVYWTEWSGVHGSSQLLDMTPGTLRKQLDAGLAIGHTFSDTESDIHITPIAKGGGGLEEWVDVVVNFGPFPTNHPPTFRLSADKTSANPGESIVFSASDVRDPDGDGVVYRWDFSDGTFGPNAQSFSKRFPTSGEFVVRCEISDLKGGKASSHMLVSIGTNSTLHVTGRVIDTSGNPVPDARVAVVGSSITLGFTDTDGRYIIAGLTNAAGVTNTAYAYGYETSPLNFENPTPVGVMNGAGLDHLATPLPKISVTVTANADERGPRTGNFHVTRQGPLTSTIAVPVAYGGTATPDKDFKKGPDYLLFTNGVSTVDIPIVPISDILSEGRETVSLQLLLATNLDRIVYAITNDGTNDILLSVTNSFPVPGWEPRIENGIRVYHQTFCPYVLGAASATLSIGDANTAPTPSVSLTLVDETALESGEDEAIIMVSRDSGFDSPLTVLYSISGTAINGLDYDTLPGTVTFPVGSKDRMIVIHAIDDLLIEGDETVTVTLAATSGYTVGGQPATAIIVDNDLPTVSVYSDRSTVVEPPTGTTTGSFTVSRSGDISQPLQVNYLLAGTATNGADFRTLSGAVVIPAGSDSTTVEVSALADGLTEDPETVILQLSASTAYNVGNASSATVTIYDATVNIVRIDFANSQLLIGEGGTGQIGLTRTGDLSKPLTVFYTLAGEIDPNSDFASIGDSVTFQARSNNVVITLASVNDPYPEWPEDLYFTLISGPGYVRSQPYTASTTIIDNDGSGLPLVEFVAGESSVPENYGSIWKIPVRISGVAAKALTPTVVEYEVRAASAKLPADFQFAQYPLLSRGWVVFDNAESALLYTNISVSVFDNTVREPDKFVLIALKYPNLVVTNTHQVTNDPVPPATEKVISTVTNYSMVPTNFALGTRMVHRLNIIDDDAGSVSVSVSKALAFEEGRVAGQFNFRRSGPLDRSLAFKVAYTGSASPNVDYLPLASDMTFPPGVDSLLVDVVPIDDITPEAGETVRANVVWVDHGQAPVASAPQEVLIVDNDGTIEFTAPLFEVSEHTGHIDVPVRRTGDASFTQSVRYRFAPGTATPVLDYSAVDGVLTFLPGETSKTIPVDVVDDTLPEPTETLDVFLEDLSGGAPLAGQSRARISILSDDWGFLFSTNRFTVAENTATAPITILRVGNSVGVVSVQFIATNGTATAGDDFKGLNQVVTFADGATSAVVNVPITDDALVEGDETVSLSLAQVEGQPPVDPAFATLVIRDDDCTLDFVSADFRVYENAGRAILTVRRLGGVINPVSVAFATANGTAFAGTDYLATNGTLSLLGDRFVSETNGIARVTFLPGETLAHVSVPILDDTLGEPAKSFAVTLSNPRSLSGVKLPGTVALGTNSTATVTILDDELPGNRDAQYANNVTPNDAVSTLTVQPSGRVVFGGDFTEVNDFTLRHVARLTSQGDLDTGFNPGIGSDGTVMALLAQPDGKILLGGSFTQVGGQFRGEIARLNADGQLDSTFDPGFGANGPVRAIALQEGGYALIGGDFTRFDGVTHTRLARLDPTGLVDDLFAPTIQGSVNAIAVQPDGRILIAGSFTNVNSSKLSGIARLKADGTLDTTFKPGTGFTGGAVYSIALQADGSIVVGGAFTRYNGASSPFLARLQADGTPDPTFLPGAGPDAPVRAVGIHSSGRIYIGGEFTTIDGTPRNRFARLRVDGGVDLQFAPGNGADATVRALTVLDSSAILIGGDFTTINGNPSMHIARIHGDEKLSLAGVEFVNATTTVDEGVGKVDLVVRRTGDTSVPFTVHYTTVPQGSTATAGQDYVAASGTLTFAAGVATQTLSITIIDDTIVELTESVLVKLDSASSGIDLGGQVTSTILIQDNEASVGFASATFTVSEGGTNAEVTVVRQGKVTGPASVLLTTADGTATAGQDYTATTTTVSFSGVETSKKVLIPITDDRLREPTETFTVNLSSPSAGMVIGLATATVSILDNDADKIVFVASALVADANNNGVADPGEAITLSIALRNTGSADTTNLVATLLATNNIIPTGSASRTYGTMPGDSAPVSRSFTLSNSGVTGTTLSLVLALQDGTRNLGTVQLPLALGEQALSYHSASPVVINDLGPSSPYPSIIDVSGVSGTPTRFTVTLDGLSHTSPGDLDLLLVAPDGEKSIILSDAGGNFPVTDLVITLDDSATATPPDKAPLTSGVFKPVNYINNDAFVAPAPAGPYPKSDLKFTLPDANGTWSLFIFDDTTADGGTLANGWKLNIFTSGRIAAVTDVGVSITSSPEPVTVGQNLTYTLHVVNNGPADAAGVVAHQVLPAGVTFVSASAGATVADGTVTVTLPSLAVGASSDYQIVVKPTAAGPLASTASVTTTLQDVYAPNDAASLTATAVVPSVAAPLGIRRDGSSIILSWPQNGSGVLETTSGLTPGVWTSVPDAPQVSGGLKTVTLQPSGVIRFYRLRN